MADHLLFILLLSIVVYPHENRIRVLEHQQAMMKICVGKKKEEEPMQKLCVVRTMNAFVPESVNFASQHKRTVLFC